LFNTAAEEKSFAAFFFSPTVGAEGAISVRSACSAVKVSELDNA
jgi:hypothetical protein